MGKVQENYKELARTVGLQYDQRFNVLYGQKNGYDVLVTALDKRYPYRLTIQIAARNTSSTEMDKTTKKELVKSVDAITGMKQEEYTFSFHQKNITNQAKLKVALMDSIQGILAGLQARAYQPCCGHCGQSRPTEDFRLGNMNMQICLECQGRLRDNSQRSAIIREQKREHVVMGTIGALIGSLLGVLCIIVLSQAGFISALSGFVMAWGVIKGYEILGRKLTERGMIICIIVMIAMIYVGDRIDWAILLGGDLLVSFKRVSFMLQKGIIDKASYIMNLLMLYAFALVGAIPTIKNARYGKNVQYELIKMENFSNIN